MKKLLIIVLLIFISCSNDNDESTQEETLTLIGKWYYDHYTVDGERHEFDYENEGCDSNFDKGYVTYKENGTYTISIFGDCEWYTLDGFSYVFNGDTLITSKEGYPEHKKQVVEITKSKLALLSKSDEDGDGNLDDFIEYFKR